MSLVQYHYQLHADNGEVLAADIKTDGPLPDLQAGNRIRLATDQTEDSYIIQRVEVSLTHRGAEPLQYRVDVYCEKHAI